MVRQKYVRRSHARRAAIASLGAGTVEGRDFQIIKFDDGGFGYEVLNSTNDLDDSDSKSCGDYFRSTTAR